MTDKFTTVLCACLLCLTALAQGIHAEEYADVPADTPAAAVEETPAQEAPAPAAEDVARVPVEFDAEALAEALTQAMATPTPDPDATPTPEPTPLQFTTVDASYFDDALFIGDSRTVGIAEYGNLKNATYFADVGLNVYVAQTKAVAVKNVGTVTLPQLLSQKTFGKVYIMLGINELGNDLDDITAKFSSLIDTVRAAQPNAIVYVEANLHVGPSRSSTDATFNNPRINRLNEKLAALADGKDIFYIDINEVFDDENGNLRADASGDSTHVYAKYDLDWCDWLCTKAIVR